MNSYLSAPDGLYVKLWRAFILLQLRRRHQTKNVHLNHVGWAFPAAGAEVLGTELLLCLSTLTRHFASCLSEGASCPLGQMSMIIAVQHVRLFRTGMFKNKLLRAQHL